MAVYWILLFSSQYSENADTTFITIKTFNVDSQDKYPTFSFCFSGSNFHWYNDLNVFKAYGLRTEQLEKMLKGETAIKYERKLNSKLFSKIPTFMQDGKYEDFDEFHLRPQDFIVDLQYSYENFENNVHYSKGSQRNETLSPYIYLSYQSPDLICFSRNGNDGLSSFRDHDLITLNSTVLLQDKFKHGKVQIFVHHPGQLMRSFGKPKYTKTLKTLSIQLCPNCGFVKKYPNVLEFKVSQIKILRRRPGSNDPCNIDIVNDDKHLQNELIRKLGCIPIYWKTFHALQKHWNVCESPEQLKYAFFNISDMKNFLELNKKPCNEMIIQTNDFLNSRPLVSPKDGAIAFHYTEKVYEEIQYDKSMGFASWLSNVGGFIGIFLGYSMMQFPEFIIWILDFVGKQKFKMSKGRFDV